MLKDVIQGFRVQCLGYLKRSFSIENAIGAEHVAIRVEAEKIADGPDRDDRPEGRLVF